MGYVQLHVTYLEMLGEQVEAVHEMGNYQSKILSRLEGTQDDVHRKSLADLAARHYGELRRHSIINCMVFSALALEALINSVAKDHLPSFERESLDRLDIAAKWVIIPRLAFGRGIDPGSDLIKRIKNVQKNRNFLVHAKPLQVECEGDKIARPLNDDRAEAAWQVCVDAVNALQAVATNGCSYNSKVRLPDRVEIRSRRARAADFESRGGLSPAT